jgi:hypothetical protein
MTHDLYTLLEEAPEMYLSEIQDWIALTYEVYISKPALHLNICNTGLLFKLLLLRLLSYLVFMRFAYASYLPYLYNRTVSSVYRTHFGPCRYLDT